LVEAVLPGEDIESGLIRYDMDDSSLSDVLDDAQSFSLFASNRVIWVSGAEAAVPKGRGAESQDEEAGSAERLASYLRDPTAGTVLVFDSARYDFDGDDKAKQQRVQKFYSCVPAQVEFTRYSPDAARRLAQQIAKDRGLRIAAAEIELLVEVLAAEPSRIAMEIEKLALYAGTERTVTERDVLELTPNAKASTVFALVNALGRNDRMAALESLDVLVREGEYLPLALSFLATQFRLALAAKESKLTNASQVQAFFTKQGTPMWRSRAEQVAQTATSFTLPRLQTALLKIYETDKNLRDTRPDDRVVMERFVLELTAPTRR
jgi:DNA polymerase-3 subunit delta